MSKAMWHITMSLGGCAADAPAALTARHSIGTISTLAILPLVR
jgi:hypothetical protein